MKIAYIFPGQGAQYVGMGKDFFSTFEEAKKIFLQADKLLEFSLSSLIFEGNTEELTQTKNSQVAIFVNSCAILEVLKKTFPNLSPYLCAGLSLGEYTALYASGKISFEEALLLVQKRADFMNTACEKKPGKMSAVLGLSYQQVQKVLDSIEEIWIANCNCPNQIVISGTPKGIEKATEALKKHKAKKIIPLVVHGAFHSGLMQEAQEKLQPYVQKAHIQKSAVKLLMNVTGDMEDSADQIKENLIQQITFPVLWEKGILQAEKEGIDLYIEIGCGKTLTGMNKKIRTRGKTIFIDKIENLKDLECFL